MSERQHRMNASTLAGAAALVVAGLLSTGCGDGSSSDPAASAKEFSKKGDHAAAAVQLKSALQQSPASAELRFLLGSALLDMGDAASAEVELRKAADLKHPVEAVAPKLARALLYRGEHKKLLEEFGKVDLPQPEAAAQLQAVLAESALMTGDKDAAQARVDKAVALAPSAPQVLLAQASLKGSAGDYDGALAILDGLIAKESGSTAALLLKGGFQQHLKRDTDGAIATFEKVLAIAPKSLPAHTALIGIQLARRDGEKAKAQFEAMKKVLPNHPQTQFFEAQIASQSGDFKQAREITLKLLQIAPTEPRLLQFAGAVELQMNSLVQAETYLAKALSLTPNLPLARRLLATTYLKMGNPPKALSVLRANLEAFPDDKESLALAAEAHLHAGDPKTAEAFFLKAAKLEPNDTRLRTAVALTQLSRGNTSAAFSELESIAASDKQTHSDMALISARLRRGELPEALKAIEAFEKKDPKNPLPSNLRGRTLFLLGNLPEARKSFELALSKSPAFFPAVSSLAGLDAVEGKRDAALQRYTDFLKANPKNEQALLALADVKARTGASAEDVQRAAEAAIQANPNDKASRLFLINYLLSRRDAKGAMVAAQAATAAIPNDGQLLEALGKAQTAAGDYNQALYTFATFSTLFPKSPEPYLRMADAHLLANNLNEAMLNLRRALDLAPGVIAAQRSLISVALQMKKPQLGIEVARTMQKQRPNDAVGYMFEGDVETSQKNWDAAIAAYRKGLDKKNPDALPVRLHEALVAAKRTAEADKFEATWLSTNPKDAGFLIYLGDLALVRTNFAVAEQRYLETLKLEPNNALALNNVGWMMARQGKTGAVEFAQKAVRINPDSAAMHDTLAFALEAAKDLPGAISASRQATSIAPNNPGLRLHLAKLLLKDGKKAEARTELETLAKLGAKFAGQPEVSTLLKEAGG